LPALGVLRIKDCLLKEVPRDSFHDLSKLVHLDLQGNKIEALDRDTFIHNPKLTTVGLCDNKLQSLDSSLFRNNLKIKELYFRDNLLTYVDPAIFLKLPELRIFHLNNNTCIDGGKESIYSMIVHSVIEKIKSDCQGNQAESC
jgi:Leucine-rich repeat (LRR) protein